MPQPPPPPRRAHPYGASLEGLLSVALEQGGTALDRLTGCHPLDDRDAALSLLRIHDLHLGPLDPTGASTRWQHHPAIAGLKWELEEAFLARLDPAGGQGLPGATEALPHDPVAAMRAIAAFDRVPPLYVWLAEDADAASLLAFLALEGGPDGGFDDLVAIGQIGLDEGPKLELARNYWDEMGRGEAGAVHTLLHRHLVEALDLPRIPRRDQPLAALERSLLGSLLATSRWLQPELLGALGLIELQAGPRCRQVVSGLRRLGLPDGALPFYEEHAGTDPRHGKDWLDHVIAPLGNDPVLGRRLVQGARWRSAVNRRFLMAVAEHLGPGAEIGATPPSAAVAA